MLKTYHQQSLALDLIRRKARIALIQEVAGISRPVLRDTYRELHGRPSSSGRLKESTQGLTRNRKSYKEVTVFAVCYQASQFVNQETDVRKVIRAFDVFKKLCPSSQLDFSGAWTVFQELRDQKIELTKCSRCGSSALLNARSDGTERCGVCNGKLKIK
jgi:flagellar transcriptional activator FlhC